MSERGPPRDPRAAAAVHSMITLPYSTNGGGMAADGTGFGREGPGSKKIAHVILVDKVRLAIANADVYRRNVHDEATIVLLYSDCVTCVPRLLLMLAIIFCDAKRFNMHSTHRLIDP